MSGFEETLRKVMCDQNVRTAAAENSLRRELSLALVNVKENNKLSIRTMATMMGTSVSQVQRLLHNEVGGSLTLRTLVRAADAFDLELKVSLSP